jgi:hypothetical protein
MIEAIRSSKASVLTTATQRRIPKGDILHSHRRENLKFLHWLNTFVVVAKQSSRITNYHFFALKSYTTFPLSWEQERSNIYLAMLAMPFSIWEQRKLTFFTKMEHRVITTILFLLHETRGFLSIPQTWEAGSLGLKSLRSSNLILHKFFVWRLRQDVVCRCA